jgi:hypothetical protein
MLTGQVLNAMATGLFAADSDADEERARHAITGRTVPFVCTDGGTAGDGVAPQCVYINPMPADSARLKRVLLQLPVGVTADDTDSATFNVYVGSADGATQTLIATGDTSVTGPSINGGDDLVAFATYEVPITAPGDNVIEPGGSLFVEIVKNGIGVAVASATQAALVQLTVSESVGQ